MPSPSARSLPPEGGRSAHLVPAVISTEPQPLPRWRRRRRGAVLALLAAVTLAHAAVLREAMAIDLPRPAAQGGEAERMRRTVVVRMLVAAATPPAAATAGGSGAPLQTGGAGETPIGMTSDAGLALPPLPAVALPAVPRTAAPRLHAGATPVRRPVGGALRRTVDAGVDVAVPAVVVPSASPSSSARLQPADVQPADATARSFDAAVEETTTATATAAAAPAPVARTAPVAAEGSATPAGQADRADPAEPAGPTADPADPRRADAGILLAAAGATEPATAPREAAAAIGAAAPEAPPVPVYRTRLPPATVLSYDLRRGMLSGIGSLDWRPQGDRYSARLEGTVVGVRAMVWESRGTLGADGIAPVRYTDERRGRGTQAANFQRALGGGGKITYSGPSDEVPLPRGAQDRLTWLIQLAAIAAADPSRVGPGGRLSMFVSGARADADVWTFSHVGAETLAIGGRSVPTLRLVREPRSAHDTRVDVWLDPAHNYLPAKARLSNGQGSDAGEAFELMLRE